MQPANRRMVGMHGVDERQCNVAFVVLVMFVALVILCAAYGVNALYGSVHMPLILNAMNNHQLIVFLIVNVCKECSLGEPGNRPDQSLHENHVRRKRDRNAYPHTLHGCAQSDRLRRRCSDQKVNRFVDNKANGGTRTHASNCHCLSIFLLHTHLCNPIKQTTSFSRRIAEWTTVSSLLTLLFLVPSKLVLLSSTPNTQLPFPLPL